MLALNCQMMHEVALFEEMKRKEKSFCPWTFRKGLLEEKGLKTGQKEQVLKRGQSFQN